MWIPSRFLQLGQVDITEALRRLDCLDEEVWYAEEDVKTKLAGKRPTQSLFYASIDDKKFLELLAERPLEQQDIPTLGAYELTREFIDPLIQEAISYYEPGGIITRVQLARMLPGTVIDEHYDISPVLIASHRLHIPIVTNDKLQFIVDGQQILMEQGKIYELNNRVTHCVENPLDATTRIHLIIDYMPARFNFKRSKERQFDFYVREKNTARPGIKKKHTKPLELPTVIATSVVRGADQNDSHGGIYIVNLQTGKSELKVDWNTCDIDFSGRGWDRGLRGICFYKKGIVIAASDEIFFYDKEFKARASFRNDYLRHAHEMVMDGRYLYVTSTGFDSVLRFDLKKREFDRGWHYFKPERAGLSVQIFDPRSAGGPKLSNRFHINSVISREGDLLIAGRNLPALVRLDATGELSSAIDLPAGTHNVTKYGKGFVYNDTEADRIVYASNYDYRFINVPKYEESRLLNNELGDERLARQGFARGLCIDRRGLVYGGSSPSTISVYDFKSLSLHKSVNVSMDIRNAIHGLEIWPFS